MIVTYNLKDPLLIYASIHDVIDTSPLHYTRFIPHSLDVNNNIVSLHLMRRVGSFARACLLANSREIRT